MRSRRLEYANSFEAGDRLAGWSRADSSIGPYSVTNTVYLYAASGCTTGVVSHVADGTERRVEYTWTDDYRLASVSVDGAPVAEYAYDVLGNLVAVANDEESFEILVDNGHSLADVAADGTPLRVYMRGPGVDSWLGFVDMTGSTPVPYFYVTDHLGSVLAVTDANGNLVERYEYDAWGKVLSVTDANGNALTRSSIGNRILWQAREYSWTTGLYYFRNRWYDPVIGRWISKDPIGIRGGINLYEFCETAPIAKIDPSGCDVYVNAGNGAHVALQVDDPCHEGKGVSFDFGPVKGGFAEWWEPNVWFGPGKVTVMPGDKWRKYDAVIKTSKDTDRSIISAFNDYADRSHYYSVVFHNCGHAAGTTLEKAGAVGNLPFYVTPNGFLDAVSGKRGAVDSYTDHIQTGMENNPFFSPLR